MQCGSQQGLEQRNHDLSNVLTGSLSPVCWEEMFAGERLKQGEHLEVPAVMPVRDANQWGLTGDTLSRSISNLTFLSSLSCPTLLQTS